MSNPYGFRSVSGSDGRLEGDQNPWPGESGTEARRTRWTYGAWQGLSPPLIQEGPLNSLVSPDTCYHMFAPKKKQPKNLDTNGRMAFSPTKEMWVLSPWYFEDLWSMFFEIVGWPQPAHHTALEAKSSPSPATWQAMLSDGRLTGAGFKVGCSKPGVPTLQIMIWFD